MGDLLDLISRLTVKLPKSGQCSTAQDKETDEWNVTLRAQEQTDPHLNDHWVLDKGAKAIQWGKGDLLTSSVETTRNPHEKRGTSTPNSY